MTAALIILAFSLLALLLESHRRNAASHRPAPFEPDRDLRDLRDYYAAGKITLEQFEAQVEDVLESESPFPGGGRTPRGPLGALGDPRPRRPSGALAPRLSAVTTKRPADSRALRC